jgi:hypothetical protein
VPARRACFATAQIRGVVLGQSSAREKMAVRRELLEYLDARGLNIAEFDAMGKGTRTR